MSAVRTNQRNRRRSFARFLRSERGDSQVPTSIIMLAVGALILVVILAFGRTMICGLQRGYNKVVGSTMAVKESCKQTVEQPD